MSTRLCWKLSEPPPIIGSAGLPLKRLVCRLFWDTAGDGTLSYLYPKIMTLATHESWLLGVIAASEEDSELRAAAEHLLEDLRRHGSLELTIE